MHVKVGIPGTLFFYLFYPMWYEFFKELGIQVVTSGKTTKTVLDKGVREALADACVPVKLFFGHVMEIKDKVDYLFIPRIVCLNRKTVYCPKFLGLPDMIRHALENVPPIIDVRIDTRQSRFALVNSFVEVGNYLGAGKMSVLRAYFKAMRAFHRYIYFLRKGVNPQEAINYLTSANSPHIRPQLVKTKGCLKFAVLGYPYAIYDNFINVNLLSKLKKLGVSVITVENINPFLLAIQKNCGLPKRLFWTFSDLVLKAAHYLLKHRKVDGIIHVTAFGCGPDAITNKFIELEAKKFKDIPFLTVTIDEHTGEAGLATRVEAFVDMVRRRKGVQ